MWIGTFGLDAGAMAPFLYMMRDREAILDVLEAITGGRMMFNYVRPGGVFADLPVGIDTKIRALLETFDTYLDEWDALLGGNEIFRLRMKNVGVFSPETALAFGLTGASLRGSGVDFDIRKAIPYCAYPQLDFEVPLGSEGDCWDRYVDPRRGDAAGGQDDRAAARRHARGRLHREGAQGAAPAGGGGVRVV